MSPQRKNNKKDIMDPVQYPVTVETIFRAATDHSQWPGAMAAVQHHLGAAASALLGFGADGKLALLYSSANDPEFGSELECSLREALSACPFLANGAPADVALDRLADDGKLRGADRFARWLDSHGLRYMIAGVLGDEWCGNAFAMFFYTAAPGHFHNGARESFRTIRPHLETALRISRRNFEAQAYRDTGRALMDNSPHGIVLFDAAFNVLEMNREARRIVVESDGLDLKGQRLQASHASDQARLVSLLQQARDWTGDGSQALWQDNVIVRRPSGRMPIIGTVLSAHKPRPSVACRAPAALMFLRDLTHEHDPSIAAFARAFRLTPAETRLVENFAHGRTISDHARNEKISDETARWHLKNVLSKTHCRSQIQLLQLIRRSSMPRITASAG